MNNRRPFVYLFIFTIFCASSVQADIISLKNGKKIEGFILNETESEFTVKTLTGGVVKVKKDNNIVEIKIGYSGISACYTLESDPETVSTCSKLLIYLDGKKAVFAKKDSSENPVTIFLDKLQKIEILKPSSEFLAQVIKADVDLDFHYAGDSKKGRLIAMKNRKINLELRNGARVVADLNDMRMIEYRNPKLAMKEVAGSRKTARYYHYLLPGLFQFQNGAKKKSAFYWGISALLFSAAAREYSIAKSLEKKQELLFLPNSQGSNFFVFSDTSKVESEFNLHKRNFQFFIGGLAAIYIVNFIDIRFFSNDQYGVSLKMNYLPESKQPLLLIQYSMNF